MLVFGGSQGARSINHAAVEAFAGARFHVLHAAGERDLPDLQAPGPHYDLRGYISDFGEALLASDLVIARSGGSIFEIAAAGRPAVLIPYPHATADHQTANARYMEEAGAAIVIPDDELTPARLAAEVGGLLADPGRLSAMARASAALAKPDAAREIAREVLAAARGYGRAERQRRIEEGMGRVSRAGETARRVSPTSTLRSTRRVAVAGFEPPAYGAQIDGQCAGSAAAIVAIYCRDPLHPTPQWAVDVRTRETASDTQRPRRSPEPPGSVRVSR